LGVRVRKSIAVRGDVKKPAKGSIAWKNSFPKLKNISNCEL